METSLITSAIWFMISLKTATGQPAWWQTMRKNNYYQATSSSSKVYAANL
jgi:hypothetical protein